MRKRNASVPVGLSFLAALICAGAFLIFITMAALARDLGQWENEDPKIQQWYRSLMQPDNPSVPCCGTADAYWADEVEYKNGQVIATITDTRPNEPLMRRPIPVGKKYIIPQSKITYRYGNPTGHVIVFINAVDDVLCYVMNGGV